jgi:hypothetical protein
VELMLRIALGLFALAMNVTGPRAFLAEGPSRPYQRAEAGESAAREVRRVAKAAVRRIAPPPVCPRPAPRVKPAPPEARTPIVAVREAPPGARGPPSV